MRKNLARAKLKQGQSSIGTWLTLPDPVGAHLMARVGFDWLTVELEHTPTTFETAAAANFLQDKKKASKDKSQQARLQMMSTPWP